MQSQFTVGISLEGKGDPGRGDLATLFIILPVPDKLRHAILSPVQQVRAALKGWADRVPDASA